MSTLEPERGTGTGTLVEPTPQVSHGDGDHERFAHYVQKDKIMESALGGTPVVALCGKVWVPGRDPKKYPVCPMCKEIYESMALTATRTRAARTSRGSRDFPPGDRREVPTSEGEGPRCAQPRPGAFSMPRGRVRVGATSTLRNGCCAGCNRLVVAKG